MRELSEAQIAQFEADVTTLCWAWRITRKDDVVMGFTDHDIDLVIDGLTYEAGSGFDTGVQRQESGFSVNSARVDSVFNSDHITEEDLRAGVYDGAKVDLFRVNWQDVSTVLAMAHWRFGDVRMGESRFEVELIGRTAQLDRSTGRVFSRFCDAELGDERCGLNLEDFPAGTVCPRTFEACQNQFSNTVNFRGFPFIVGDDALTRSPQRGEILDGGSRFR